MQILQRRWSHIAKLVNLIKEQFVLPHQQINKNRILKLSRITDHCLFTKGSIKVIILGCETTFHIVNNDLPIEQAGILGNDFFLDNGVTINYDRQCLDVKGKTVPFIGKTIL